MRERNYLFSNISWFDVQENQKKKLCDEVNSMDGDRLLNTSVDDLCNYFEKKYRIDVPILRENNIVADQQETKIDMSHDFDGYYRRPLYVAGTCIEITIPFDGEAERFNIQPSSYTLNPPIGEVSANSVVFKIEGVDLDAEKVKKQINQTISEINNYLQNLRKDVEKFNSQVWTFAHQTLEQRRKKLLANRNLVSSLGFRLKERTGVSRTYVAPEVRRKIVPVLPPASTKAFKPEPTLSANDYDHILDVIQNMAQVMERSPSAFSAMDEESLRFHFLVQLNGHYEGQATGETFNYEGKTDILIRSKGKNIFIAECKFWDGPNKLRDALNQLLTYSSWRDTKVAMIIFNRNKNFSGVLDIIPKTVEAHPNYKRTVGKYSETNFRYVFAHRDDPNREIILTLLAFDVPDKNQGCAKK
jgi:hypothetical protein